MPVSTATCLHPRPADGTSRPGRNQCKGNGGGTTPSSHGCYSSWTAPGPTGITTRIKALRAAAADLALSGFLRNVPVLAAPLVDLLHGGPSEPVWRPVRDPGSTVGWMRSTPL
ncbi:hypothetical protein [Streptomyces sp. NPDC056165]|uniref:hypothetical protein n=1 Tax=Streptomyces sp. NPDC056165 TaxID=3345733 RepID=UPI0035DE345E